jgi:hypothetical protein
MYVSRLFLFVMNLSDSYFSPKKWEGDGSFYKWIGVVWYKQFITWLGRKVGRNSEKENNYFLWDKSEAGIRAFEVQTRSSELMHLAGMLLPVFGLLSAQLDTTTEIILWLVLVVNIHPFLLQRYNRIRLVGYLKKMEMRKRKSNS